MDNISVLQDSLVTGVTGHLSPARSSVWPRGLDCCHPEPRLLVIMTLIMSHVMSVTCDNVMSVTCDNDECDMTQVRAGNELTLESCMWPQRAGAGRDSEPPERRTGLQSTGTSGERHTERVSATW